MKIQRNLGDSFRNSVGNFLDFGNFQHLRSSPVSNFPAFYEHYAIRQIFLYQVDSAVRFVYTNTLNSDFFVGQRFPLLKQAGLIGERHYGNGVFYQELNHMTRLSFEPRPPDPNSRALRITHTEMNGKEKEVYCVQNGKLNFFTVSLILYSTVKSTNCNLNSNTMRDLDVQNTAELQPATQSYNSNCLFPVLTFYPLCTRQVHIRSVHNYQVHILQIVHRGVSLRYPFAAVLPCVWVTFPFCWFVRASPRRVLQNIRVCDNCFTDSSACFILFLLTCPERNITSSASVTITTYLQYSKVGKDLSFF